MPELNQEEKVALRTGVAINAQVAWFYSEVIKTLYFKQFDCFLTLWSLCKGGKVTNMPPEHVADLKAKYIMTKSDTIPEGVRQLVFAMVVYKKKPFRDVLWSTSLVNPFVN